VSDLRLRFYHALPAPARPLVASLRGFFLRHWRYGPETDRLADEAIARESWTAERWQVWRQERLAFVLHRAATRVPYYRDQWAERRRRGDQASWELLENWPVLEKPALRQHPLAFLAEGCDPRHMFPEHTSGSTGTPLRLWWSRETVRAWYALFEARCRGWNGVSRRDRWAVLGGQLVTPVRQRKPPFWVWNAPMRQLYLSSFHLAPDFAGYYLEALDRYQVKYLFGYSSCLNTLAQQALRRGWRGRGLAVAITNAEPLYEHQRAAIGEAFACPVRETYGMAEIVAGATECAEGRLHFWPEVGWVEVLTSNGLSAEEGRAGDLVCTGLLNADMPLIRYRVGDRGRKPVASACACGRRLPVLPPVEGRSDDVLLTRDGRRLGRLDLVFKSSMPIAEAQIIQETAGRLRIRYVPAAGCTSETERLISGRVRDYFGEVEIAFEAVASIPVDANGKFRGVISRLGGAEKN
jgi:phenylacetate-CoA ligase